MQLIPSTPHRTGSRAELRVFDRLRSAFAGDRHLRLTAFHSLNLTSHRTKRFGEIDFLLIGRPGIFVLEVKGGGLRCDKGIWFATDGAGVPRRLRESPFRQARSGLHGLMEKLRARFPVSVLAGFRVGYGVIFPDCDFDPQGAEWDAAVLADMRGSRDLEGWLSGLFRYWGERDQRPSPEPQDPAIDQLKEYLRPGFEVAVPLHVRLEELEERVAALTRDQMRMLDVVDANPRVICTGGAGTGKTFLALELARRWSAAGRQVLLVCHSPWLKRWLETKFALPGVAVSVPAGVETAARRKGVAVFDALIVDEGQDLLSLNLFERLSAVLHGGLELGRWCFFHDLNNQAGFFGPSDPRALAQLESYGPARVPLTTNCRNTRQIRDAVQSRLGVDMGARGSGDGPRVVERTAGTRQESARLLAAEIERLTGQGGLSPRRITILSAAPFAQSSAAALPRAIESRVIAVDEYALRSFPPPGISFARVVDFKGLENEAVVLVDLPPPAAGAPSPIHYVGMSRARSLLTMIWSGSEGPA